jgi:two-component system, NarL family, sensor histidine kinase LiaS
MNIIFRHVFIANIFSILLTIVLMIITFVLFPLDRWSLLWQAKMGNVSFFVWIGGIAIGIGTIVGLSTGWYWKQRIDQIHRNLDEIIKGQPISSDEVGYKEIESIAAQIAKIQEKIRKQTEYSQRLVTERANEREKSLQEIVVQERNRLARELHDSVSQQLFASSMMMSAINESNSPIDEKMKKQLQMVEKMIHQSQLEMRALLLHLRPVQLKGKSLQEGIRELLAELTQKVPMKTICKIEDFFVDKGIEDQLFRILQESLSNTLRHAKATKLQILLIKRDESVILRVVDDGVGFHLDEIKTGSYGLQNMRERAYEIGGTFKIVSLPNQGTQMEVKVPILQKEENRDD